MAFEKRWAAIAPRSLLVDGTAQGLVTVADAIDLHVKQIIFLKGSALPSKKVQINAVISQTEIIVGEIGSKIDEFTDVSIYTVASASTISSEIQPRPSIPDKEYERASFEEEPVVAKRVIQVDPYGDKYTTKNPFPVSLSDGDVSIGTVNAELEVQLSRKDNDPDAGDVHDAVRIGNQDGEMSYSSDDLTSKFSADMSTINKVIDVPFAKITVAAKTEDGDPEIIEIRNSAGTVVRTLTLLYDSDGDFLDVEKS